MVKLELFPKIAPKHVERIKEIDRKMLADLAVHDAEAFKAISDKAKSALETA